MDWSGHIGPIWSKVGLHGGQRAPTCEWSPITENTCNGNDVIIIVHNDVIVVVDNDVIVIVDNDVIVIVDQR